MLVTALVTMGCDGEQKPRQQAEQAQDVAAVRRALDGLDARDRELLLMREEGFSYREMAEALDIPEASVGTLLARAKRAFRFRYGEGDEPS